MKEYPLTEGELTALTAIGGLATLLFSIGTGLLGFGVNLSKDIAFASNLPKDVSVFWDTIRVGAWVGCITSYIVGGILVFVGRSKVGEIKRETSHE